MRRWFYHTDLGQNAVFTILQDKLHSLAVILDDRDTLFLCTTNYRIDHIIKRFHEENSMMLELFSQKNLLLCGMQGNNGLLAKPFKNFQTHLSGQPVLTFNDFRWL